MSLLAPEAPLYELPDHALRVIHALESAGFDAWVVGGWVRDALRGVEPHDVDVTSSAPWQQAKSCLEAAGIAVRETGTAHGTVTAVVDARPIEVTTYRVEGSYSDHRHPDEVHFVTDVREDLARRDFTINAMAFHPRRGLLDPFGGRADLARGVIRAVGDPRLRFEEDALRVLRAVRFACRLGFDIEPATHAALVASASGLDDIAQERVGQEMEGIVSSGRVGWALLNAGEPLFHAIPELRAMRGFDQRSPYHSYDVLEHTACVCKAVEEFTGGLASDELRWAALLHDVAKPLCFTLDQEGRGHFYGHPQQGAKMAERIMRRLSLPNSLVLPVRTLVRLHDHMVMASGRSIRRTLLKFEKACPGRARELCFALIDLKRADAVSKTPAAARYAVEVDQVTMALRRELASGAVWKLRDLTVSGADVMAETGIAPGPGVGIILDGLLSSVVNGDLPNEREQLLAAIRLRG